jgi:hypothetical protein
LVALVLLPAEAPAADRLCRPPHSRTLLATATTRVYDVPTDYGANRVFACRYARGRAWSLGDTYEDPGGNDSLFLEPVRPSGRYLAYVKTFTYRDRPAGAELFVRDLQTGRRLHHYERSDYTIGNGVAMDRQGSIAWVGKVARSGYEVRRADRLGENTRLDAGPDIDPESLGLKRSVVSWRNAGVSRAAPLR